MDETNVPRERTADAFEDAQADEEWFMDEDERQLTNDADYWERIGSAVMTSVEPSFDAYDLIAEQVEAAYARASDKQFKHAVKPPRPSLRREKKDASENKQEPIVRVLHASNLLSAAGTSLHNIAAPAGAAVTLDPERVLEISQRVLKALTKLPEDSIPKTQQQGLSAIPEKDLKVLYAAYQHMLTLLCRSPRFQQRFGSAGTHEELHGSTIGENVPQYFANVGGESIMLRKVLSICGLRNLVVHGQGIYRELLATHFSGDPELYQGDVGLSKMRRVTGNTVDLDTVVLRCSSHLTLSAINASNRIHGIPQFSTTAEFAASSQAETIAVTCARVAIDDFIALFSGGGMSEAQQKRRNLHASQLITPIPLAVNNTTRGKHPVWHYVNVGQDSFHANVPCMPDVIGALLRAPFAAIAHYASLFIPGLYHESSSSPPSASQSVASLLTLGDTADTTALEAAHPEMFVLLEEYFDQCIADSCFNGKWKSIEEYGLALQHRGTIDDILQRLQQQHQELFPASLFDEDDEHHSKEVDLLWSVANGRHGKTAAGQIRAITKADVQKLVDHQASAAAA
ncbi:Hypothetical protein, putative [Bodo saltans]|uniref:Uncharacterized protein n=1 Tax=Bodo saltans TaxID=75058 RepID=A0A0S4KDS7_BODSA|nr:Hypothetical protein, putative [Bodo saltans]|eukprot:CUI11264.1 Hypothetical protein, putative [Bodo saltans]